MRFQQIVQPGGRGSFFERDIQVSAQSIEKLQNHAGFRFDHAFHHDLSGSIHDRDRNTFLMHVHADIFGASHKRVFLSGGVEPNTQNLLQKGRPLYCVVSDCGPRTPAHEAGTSFSSVCGHRHGDSSERSSENVPRETSVCCPTMPKILRTGPNIADPEPPTLM